MQTTFYGKAPAGQAKKGKRPQTVITDEDAARGARLLKEYMAGKEALDRRLVEDELWWQMRHWEIKRKNAGENRRPLPSSAWLFNTIVSKHADAMDNYPVPSVLPREQSDAPSAELLSAVLPVVFEDNRFEETYSANWWEKLKHGAAAYGVFWDGEKRSGLGDVAVRAVDLLRLYWEPGVTDLQKSANLFLVDLADVAELEALYPEKRGRFGGAAGQVRQYLFADNVDTTGKCMVVDWYYKVRNDAGRVLLHYVKFCGDAVLYASENDPVYRDTGFYAHGQYPIVLDTLFPEKGTPAGFGYVTVCKDAQTYIDAVSANIQESTLLSTKRRYFASRSTNIDVGQLLDNENAIVWVDGDVTDTRLKPFRVDPVDPMALSVMNQKIDEMKETAANRDVNNGAGGRGVTAAAAIAALQEAGNKTSRDMVAASYRAYARVAELVVELMRQFYDEARSFRVVGPRAAWRFVTWGNAGIREQAVGADALGNTLYRLPVFDYRIGAVRKNPFSRMEQNELAKELYRLGFFSPERAEQSLLALELMDFDGADRVREYLRKQAGTGRETAPEPPPEESEKGVAAAVTEAQTPREGYDRTLARRTAGGTA